MAPAPRFERLRQLLAARTPRVLEEGTLPPGAVPQGGLRPAAVLVPLFARGGEPHVLLTLRCAGLRQHAGQISFPGGRLEPGESPLEAALREAREEVGLEPTRVEVLGQLDELLVLATGFRLTPWVGVVPDGQPYRPQPGEVERLIEAPLSALAAHGVHRIEERTLFGQAFELHHYDLPGAAVWGATARVLAQLLHLWSEGAGPGGKGDAT